MSSITVRDLLIGAYRLLNIVASGETPDATLLTDGLVSLNQMLDSWSTEGLSIYSTKDEQFTWPSGQISRTIGPTGNFVTARPIDIDTSTYYVDASTGMSFPIQFVSQEQYNVIRVKTLSLSYPTYMFVNMAYPDIEMFFYPVPAINLQMHIISPTALPQVSSLNDLLSLPPGYLRAIRYNLALEISSDLGLSPLPDLRNIALVSKRNIQRINAPSLVMSLPTSLTNRMNNYNIFTGAS